MFTIYTNDCLIHTKCTPKTCSDGGAYLYHYLIFIYCVDIMIGECKFNNSLMYMCKLSRKYVLLLFRWQHLCEHRLSCILVCHTAFAHPMRLQHKNMMLSQQKSSSYPTGYLLYPVKRLRGLCVVFIVYECIRCIEWITMCSASVRIPDWVYKNKVSCDSLIKGWRLWLIFLL